MSMYHLTRIGAFTVILCTHNVHMFDIRMIEIILLFGFVVIVIKILTLINATLIY